MQACSLQVEVSQASSQKNQHGTEDLCNSQKMPSLRLTCQHLLKRISSSPAGFRHSRSYKQQGRQSLLLYRWRRGAELRCRISHSLMQPKLQSASTTLMLSADCRLYSCLKPFVTPLGGTLQENGYFISVCIFAGDMNTSRGKGRLRCKL